MQIYRTIGGQYPIHGVILPMNTVVLVVDAKTEIMCMNFHTPRKNKLNVIIYDCVEKTWTRCKMQNKYTEIMWDYHRKTQAKPDHKTNYAKLMRHDRKHKSGSGGVRLGKFNGTVTDYECTKNLLHDFRRVYN